MSIHHFLGSSPKDKVIWQTSEREENALMLASVVKYNINMGGMERV